ncbi:MAG: acetate kinase [Rhodanobacter sp.]
MKRKALRNLCSTGCAGLFIWCGSTAAQDVASVSTDQSYPSSESIRKAMTEQGQRLDAMREQIEAQSAQLETMRKVLSAQQAKYLALRHAVGMDALDSQRAGNVRAGGSGASAAPMPSGDDIAAADSTTDGDNRPVGRAPANSDRPPEVAPIFDQPGVLTPRNRLVIEPSYQFGYSSNDRVALVGYTVIPAILIGLIDVRQVRTTTQTASLAMRYGLTNRLELELRVPYVQSHTDTVSREIFTGTAQDNVFGAGGHGIGDVEATARYQLNDGGADKPYYVGWLRFKSRTGRDPFEVVTDCVTRCVQNATGTGLPLQTPTGSGFYSLQPGMTWLFPSDPVVFFGNLSYLHNFARHDVSRTVLLGGKESLGTVKVGDVVDASIGMGLALNEKASISIGYDQSFVGLTRQNGKTVAGSARSVLGTLLLGGSYRLNDKRTINFSLGVGVTRDTPDATVTVRVPMMY